MKKVMIPLLAIVSMLALTPKVEAKTINYASYNKLGITSTYVVGDYIFNLDNGYSPTLRDIMIASRTIPKDEPTTLYSILNMPEFGFFRQLEIYSGISKNSSNEFKLINAKYVYHQSIFGATADQFEEL